MLNCGSLSPPYNPMMTDYQEYYIIIQTLAVYELNDPNIDTNAQIDT